MKPFLLATLLALLATNSQAQQPNEIEAGTINTQKQNNHSVTQNFNKPYISLKRNFEVSFITPPAIPLNKIVSWPLNIKSIKKDFLTMDVNFVVAGGMPHHGHGLPTSPVIEKTSKPDEFIIKGLKFSMPGYWEVKIKAQKGDLTDVTTISFNIDR